MRVLLILGHTKHKSFCGSLLHYYAKGAKNIGHEVRVIHLEKKSFLDNPFSSEHDDAMDKSIRKIEWAEHIVFVHPIWWASQPARLKAFIDKVFTDGFAFKRDEKGKLIKLLKGKSIEIIATMDSSPVGYKFKEKEPAYYVLKHLADFTGMKFTKKRYFGSVKKSNVRQRKAWLKEVFLRGKSLK